MPDGERTVVEWRGEKETHEGMLLPADYRGPVHLRYPLWSIGEEEARYLFEPERDLRLLRIREPE